MLQLIKRFAGNLAFSPEEVNLLVAAFDDAWQQLEKSGVRFEKKEQRESARNLIGKLIIEHAKAGVRDHLQLRDWALLQYSQAAGRAG